MPWFKNVWEPLAYTHKHRYNQRKEIDCGLGGTLGLCWSFCFLALCVLRRSILPKKKQKSWTANTGSTFHFPYQNQKVFPFGELRAGASTWRPRVRSLTSLPWFWRNSTSCWEKVVMEIDLTLCGGLRPLLGHRGDMERGIWTTARQKIWRCEVIPGLWDKTWGQSRWERKCLTCDWV